MHQKKKREPASVIAPHPTSRLVPLLPVGIPLLSFSRGDEAECCAPALSLSSRSDSSSRTAKSLTFLHLPPPPAKDTTKTDRKRTRNSESYDTYTFPPPPIQASSYSRKRPDPGQKITKQPSSSPPSTRSRLSHQAPWTMPPHPIHRPGRASHTYIHTSIDQSVCQINARSDRLDRHHPLTWRASSTSAAAAEPAAWAIRSFNSALSIYLSIPIDSACSRLCLPARPVSLSLSLPPLWPNSTAIKHKDTKDKTHTRHHWKRKERKKEKSPLQSPSPKAGHLCRIRPHKPGERTPSPTIAMRAHIHIQFTHSFNSLALADSTSRRRRPSELHLRPCLQFEAGQADISSVQP